jgi:hypothetical protein
MEESWGHYGLTGVAAGDWQLSLGTGVPESGSMAGTSTLIQCPKLAVPETPAFAKCHSYAG